MTKQILAFLFCFIRELTLYSPLPLSLTSARELKPIPPPYPHPPPTHPPIPSPSAHGGKIWSKKNSFNTIELQNQLQKLKL